MTFFFTKYSDIVLIVLESRTYKTVIKEVKIEIDINLIVYFLALISHLRPKQFTICSSKTSTHITVQ